MWNPKDNMSLCAYWTAFDGVNLSGNNVVSLTDLSGSGNDLTAINNPQIVANGINGVQSIRFNGTNRLERILPINGITDLNNRSGWIVFKIEDINGVGYHNVFLLGGASYTSSGSNFMQLYNTNNSPIFYQNYTTNTLDASINLPQTQAHYCIFNKSNGANANFDGSVTNTVGVQTINNNGLFVGQWNSKGAKMLFCEMAILNNEISEADKVNLENYFAIKYGIKKNIEVINSGVNGNNTQDIINRLPQINEHNAQYAFVQCLVNNFRHPDISKRRTPQQSKVELTTIIESLKTNGTIPIIISMLPIEPIESDYVCSMFNEPIGCDIEALGNQYRSVMMEVCVEQNIDYIDAYSKFLAVNQPRYAYDSFMENIFNSGSSDGVHLRPLGAKFEAGLLFAYINEKQINATKYIYVGDSTVFCDGLPIEQKTSTILQKLLNA